MNVATYYDILKVDRAAAPERVRAAYRSLAQRYHPDKLPGNANAERVMAALNEAYAVLSDPQQRATYDRSIENARVPAVRRQRTIVNAELRVAAWPWWLLFATFAFSAAAIGTVAYHSLFASSLASAAAARPAPRGN
ncbi:MAG: DnaJ domain-containing protein [Ramlibacter sp.]|nr:DnaJ domain-containing protein [Ramlibacter sp.]